MVAFVDPILPLTAKEAISEIADVIHLSAADDPAVYGKIQVILFQYMTGPDNVDP